MYCKNCGHKVEDGKKFCKHCGTPIPSAAPVTPPDSKESPSQKVVHGAGWIKKNRRWLIPVIVVGVIVLGIVVLALVPSGDDDSSNPQQSVVDINCDNGYGGSGTIFTSDGIVLTNNHVITGAKSCEVTIPDPTTGAIDEIYEAAPVIVPTLSKEYDVATLKIDSSYTDDNGKTWGPYPTTFTPFSLPSSCDPTAPSQLGDSVKIYGYPVTSGGFNLTVTTGVISSFADNGDILTSAQIDSGNSGGLAIDQNGCWLGIPSAVLSGNYQNLGVIIPGAIVEQFLNNVPAKSDPAADVSSTTESAAESAALPNVPPDQYCQNEYGQYSESSGGTDSDGNPTCECQSGYTWDTTGDSCASQTSLDQSCEDTYGSESYSYLQGTGQNQKSTCGCSSGYEWNADQSACIVVPQESNAQICQNNYGPNSIWDGNTNSNGGPECDCASGYTWNAARTECVAETGYQVCSSEYPNSTWDGTSYTSSGGYSCSCNSGYTMNSSQTACVANSTQNGYQACSVYPNETWGGSYASNGNYQCVCDAGYTWDSTTQSCY